MKRLLGIQYLRAIAAVMVVLFHAADREEYVFHLGEAGVDLFFVLSGFLIVAITGEATKPIPFMLDRIKRIVPLYWISTTLMLIGSIVGAFPSILLTHWYVVSSYLFIPSEAPNSGELLPILVPGWTLNYEMFFYSLFAALMLIRAEAARVAVLGWILCALVLAGWLAPSSTPLVSFYTDPIVLEFLIGALIGLFWKRGLFEGRSGLIPLGAGVLLFSLAGFINSASWRLLLFGVPSALVLIGFLGLEAAGMIRHWRFPLLLGDASYSIYLWHGIALSVAVKIGVLIGISSTGVVLLGLISGVALGLIAYILIEKPILAALRRRRYARGVPVPSGP